MDAETRIASPSSSPASLTFPIPSTDLIGDAALSLFMDLPVRMTGLLFNWQNPSNVDMMDTSASPRHEIEV